MHDTRAADLNTLVYAPQPQSGKFACCRCAEHEDFLALHGGDDLRLTHATKQSVFSSQ